MHILLSTAAAATRAAVSAQRDIPVALIIRTRALSSPSPASFIRCRWRRRRRRCPWLLCSGERLHTLLLHLPLPCCECWPCGSSPSVASRTQAALQPLTATLHAPIHVWASAAATASEWLRGTENSGSSSSTHWLHEPHASATLSLSLSLLPHDKRQPVPAASMAEDPEAHPLMMRSRRRTLLLSSSPRCCCCRCRRCCSSLSLTSFMLELSDQNSMSNGFF